MINNFRKILLIVETKEGNPGIQPIFNWVPVTPAIEEHQNHLAKHILTQINSEKILLRFSLFDNFI